MTEDATLDDFFGPVDADDDPDESGATEPEDDAAGGSAGTGEGRETGVDEPGDVTGRDGTRGDDESDGRTAPFGATLEWAPDGRQCADCGATVDRLWTGEREGEPVRVCRECKDW